MGGKLTAALRTNTSDLVKWVAISRKISAGSIVKDSTGGSGDFVLLPEKSLLSRSVIELGGIPRDF